MVEYSRLTPEVREKLLQIIDQVKPRFDWVLIDTGAGISDVVLFAVSLAKDVLVVATPEPTSLTDAYATIKVLANTQQRKTIGLVLNQASRAGEGKVVCGQLQAVLARFASTQSGFKLDLWGEIPNDPAVRQAVLKRQLLLELNPGCNAAQGLRQLAQAIVGV
jgi:flagellar biosynthesis protein FlhG